MLRLKPNPTFEAKVSIPDPSGPAMVLVVQFKHKTKDEFADYTMRSASMPDLDTVAEIVVGWKDCDTEFSADALKQLLQNYPGASFAFSKAYGEALFQGRQGN